MAPVGIKRPVILATAGVLAIASSAILIRLAFAEAGRADPFFALAIAAARILVATLLLLPFSGLKKIKTSDLPAIRFALLSGLILAIHFGTWFSSLAYTSVVISTTLVSTNPIWVALLSLIFLKEFPPAKAWPGIIIAIVGSFWMSLQEAQALESTEVELLGPLLALMGAICASCYLLLGQAAQRRGLSVLQYSVIAYGTAGSALAMGVTLFGSWPTWSPVLLLIVAAMALGPQIFGHTSINGLLRVWKPASVATLILLEPVGAGVFAGLFLDEWPSTSVFMGAAIVLGGVLWTIRIQET